MSRPLITIAISTYNRADSFLREALESALKQSYEALEIVVVDNASTDQTARLVSSLADERVRYVRNDTNIGANGNFNACLDNARGAYFLLLHDDDRIDADFVSSCMHAWSQWNGDALPGLVRTGVRVIDGDGKTLSERRNLAGPGSAADLARAWFHGSTPMYFCNTLFHTASLREVGGFHSKHDLYVDVAAVFRIAARRPVLNIVEEKASFRRHGGNNGTAQSITEWCEDSLYLLDLMCALAPSASAELRSLGLAYFTGDNYTRAARIGNVRERTRAYWTVYRLFGYLVSPWRMAAYRHVRRLKRAVDGASA